MLEILDAILGVIVVVCVIGLIVWSFIALFRIISKLDKLKHFKQIKKSTQDKILYCYTKEPLHPPVYQVIKYLGYYKRSDYYSFCYLYIETDSLDNMNFEDGVEKCLKYDEFKKFKKL